MHQYEGETLFGCLLCMPQLGTEPRTQVCILTQNRTCDFLVYRMMLNKWATRARAKASLFFFFSFFKIFYYSSITVIRISSPPLHATPDKPTFLPCFHSPPWFCPCVLYSSSWKPLSPLSLPPSPLAIIRLFLTSMSLVIFCLFFSSVDYVPIKGEIIWYSSLTAWLISLNIMLSSSIHDVQKGISSFFPLLHRIPLCKCTIVFWSTHLLMGT